MHASHSARGSDAPELLAADAAVAGRRRARPGRGAHDGRPVDPGEAVTIEADVVDRSFVPLNDAVVWRTSTRPNGGTLQVPLQWTGERDGQSIAGRSSAASPATTR
jgi:hypothetical protein